MKTRLTEMLHVEHPVMLAGMGGVAYSALVAAVSNAGGYGCLGASTMSSARLASEIAATKELTPKPFGVDLLTAFPETLTQNVELLIEGGASTFVAGLGVPAHVIDLCHRHGVLVISMCGKVEHATRALDAGCDIVVAQGTEAGGHTGTVATLPLVPLIVDAMDGAIPVVAAGGIFDGRGLAAALSLGAAGVWIGTRFIATPEARAIPGYRETILATREDGTVVSRAFSGKTMRVLRNDTTDRYERRSVTLEEVPGPVGRRVQRRDVPPRRRRTHRGRQSATRGLPGRSGRRSDHRRRRGRGHRALDRGRGPRGDRRARRSLKVRRMDLVFFHDPSSPDRR